MLKAYDVMTHALATCPPDASIARVAALMRDRDIGDVLVVENGNLRGIVTDRDLALHALTGEYDPQLTPVEKFMSTKLVTGEPGWSMKQVAQVMAKNQIRRLPIIDEGQLAGIISLSDVARNENRKTVVAKSLAKISEPNGSSGSRSLISSGALIGIGLAALATSLATWLTWNHSGKEVRKQIADSKYYHTAQKAAKEAARAARDKVEETTSSPKVRSFQRQMRSNMKDLSAHLPTIQYKPPKRKTVWFG